MMLDYLNMTKNSDQSKPVETRNDSEDTYHETNDPTLLMNENVEDGKQQNEFSETQKETFIVDISWNESDGLNERNVEENFFSESNSTPTLEYYTLNESEDARYSNEHFPEQQFSDLNVETLSENDELFLRENDSESTEYSLDEPTLQSSDISSRKRIPI